MELIQQIGILQRIEDCKVACADMEDRFYRPAFCDLSNIGDVYGRFRKVCKERGHAIGKSDERRKFLFVALMLYSPSVFVGKKMRAGLRDKLCGVLDVYPTMISDEIRTLLFQYQNYKGFAREVNEAMGGILEWVDEITNCKTE